MVQGREGKVSFSQCPAQESETYVVYTKDDSDPYKLYVYSKAEEAVVLKIKDVERWRLAGNTLFYSRACTDHLIVGYYPEDVYAVSLDTRQEKLLAENVMNYLVLREDKLIYALYRDVEYEKDGKLPVYQEEPALVPYYEMALPEGGVRRLGLFEYTGRYDSRLYASFVEGDCFYYTDRVDGRRVVMRYDVAARRRDIVSVSYTHLPAPCSGAAPPKAWSPRRPAGSPAAPPKGFSLPGAPAPATLPPSPATAAFPLCKRRFAPPRRTARTASAPPP